MENMINIADGSFMRVETITPEIADSLLQTNDMNNRNISRNTVDYYTKSMTELKWCLNGSSIVISENGALIDGQHRLLACINSGISFDTFVHRGVKHNAMRTIDTGKPRSDGDLITMETGYTYPHQLATAIRYASMYTKGSFWSKDNNNLRLTLDSGEPIDDLMERIGFPHLHDSVVLCCRVRKGEGVKIISPSRLAVIHHVIRNMSNRNIADGFVKKVYSLYGMRKGDPILAFHKTIQNYQEKKVNSSSNNIDLMLLVKAWNKFVEGKEVKRALSVKGLKRTASLNKPSIDVNLYIDNDGILQREFINA